jgi:hypothetical protein
LITSGSAEHQRHQIRHIAKIQQKYGYTGADCIDDILRVAFYQTTKSINNSIFLHWQMLIGAPICNATLLATRLEECHAKNVQSVGQVQGAISIPLPLLEANE